MSTAFRLAILIFAFALPAFGADALKSWPSPDHTHIATATTRLYPDKPDRRDLAWDDVSIRDAKGHPLASITLETGSGINRGVVSDALWSPDSRFFVFVTESSGGHSSWHAPTYVYDATTSRIYSIDDTIKSVTPDEKLTFTKGDSLKILFWDGPNAEPESSPRTIDLIEFAAKGPKLAVGTHRFSH